MTTTQFSSKTLLSSLAGFAALLAIAFFTGCHHSTAAKDKDQDAKDKTLEPVMVTVAPVQVRPVERSVEAVGTIYSFEEVTISTKVEGRVRRILHDVSDRV